MIKYPCLDKKEEKEWPCLSKNGINATTPEEWDKSASYEERAKEFKDVPVITNEEAKASIDKVALRRKQYKDGIPAFKVKAKDTQVTSAKDIQIGGAHYLNKHQPLYIVLELEGYIAFMGACMAKMYKYLQRKKEGEHRLEAFKKARHVLDMLIEETENENCKKR